MQGGIVFHCPDCRFEVEENYRFCPRCGKNLEKLIQTFPCCGFKSLINPKTLNYCIMCGRELRSLI